MRDFRELKVWEKAHRLTLQVYRITKNFPFLLMNNLDLLFSCAGLRHPFQRTSLKVAEEIVSENLTRPIEAVGRDDSAIDRPSVAPADGYGRQAVAA
jgi:hypothetical protein